MGNLFAHPRVSCSMCLISNPSKSIEQGPKAPAVQRKKDIAITVLVGDNRFNSGIVYTLRPFLSEALFLLNYTKSELDLAHHWKGITGFILEIGQ